VRWSVVSDDGHEEEGLIAFAVGIGSPAPVPALTVLQALLLFPYHMNAQGVLRAISALHVLNALLIFWVAFQLVERTRLYMASPVGTDQVGR